MEVDRRIWDPHENEPFLSWYQGHFESVYIALHPFCKIDGINPDTAPPHVFVVNRADFPGDLTLDNLKDAQARWQEQFSVDSRTLERREKECGLAIPWSEITSGCGFDSIAEVYVSLLTAIMAISKNLWNETSLEKLKKYCSVNQIFLPREDTFPPIDESKICLFLKRIECEKVVISDDTHSDMHVINRDDLDNVLPWFQLESVKFRVSKIFPEDHSFLLAVPYDNFYTAICGSRSMLETAGVEQLFEGFWCDATTRPFWWQQ